MNAANSLSANHDDEHEEEFESFKDKKIFPQGDSNVIQIHVEGVIAKLLKIDEQLRQSFGHNLLSHEFRLILQVAIRESRNVKQASLASLLSGRAFHALLKRLAQCGIIQFASNPSDRRSKNITLAGDFENFLYTQLSGLFASPKEKGKQELDFNLADQSLRDPAHTSKANIVSLQSPRRA
ncbi:MarR family transcriptional regulator [Novosphingobium malaysiense]|uniref:Uncharacterized protein n=1 Tax=Novosphingobium malaysiense TaxID=1348853 RepID=A0A0B1ZQZ3_9SPHN|nr:helix-turn-helix domain-containing protein [Novosphingobium malaysiense]KHK93580.1 hypothetical protein LK12_04895 [Novosphingobium malaysiense]